MRLIRNLILVPVLMLTMIPAGSAAPLPSSIEKDAIRLTEQALARDAKGAQAIYQRMLGEVRALHRAVASKPFDERHAREATMAKAWLHLVSVNMENHSMIGVAIAANQLSAEMIRFQHAGSGARWDTHWLGYLGRELMLLAKEDAAVNTELLASRRSDALSTWQRLRLEVIRDFRHKPLVEEGDAMLNHLTSDTSPDSTIRYGEALAGFAGRLDHELAG